MNNKRPEVPCKKSDQIQESDNYTPNFREQIPRGFAETYLDSVLSQESDLTSTNRTNSDFSDHVSNYRSKIQSSVTPVRDERLSERNCNCNLI